IRAAGSPQGANYSPLWGQRAERSGDSRKRGGRSSAIRFAVHHDQRLLHKRDERPLVACLCVHLSARDDERPTRFHDMTFRQQALARRRREQVQLEFDGEHGAVLGKQREAGVTARRIDNRADDAGVNIAMLLRDFGPRLDRNRAIPRTHVDDLRTDQRHRALPRKARPRPFGVSRECRPERGSSVGQWTSGWGDTIRDHTDAPKNTILTYVYVNVNLAKFAPQGQGAGAPPLGAAGSA